MQSSRYQKTIKEGNFMAFNSSQEKNSKALTIIGIVLCIILIPALVINCVLIIKSFVNKDEIPNIGGTMMFIVLSDSMHPEIKSGDIIVCKEIAPEDVDVNMVISFYDPASKGTAVVTHKIVEKIEEDGKLYFRTRGINNNSDDKILVPADRIIAQYTGIRFPWVGDIAMFMQTTVGLIVCVIVPIVLFRV